MTALAYYNEIDRDAVHVLRCLIADGLIAPGDVDDRSIKDVRPDDLAGYTQCHFFAGAGVWSLAARMAGWPDDRPLWTGSCPCQPFSAAGKGRGTDDPRHLWPDFFRLIRECRPAVVFGEQVSNAARRAQQADAHMQGMWAGETVLGILQDQGQARQFEWLSCALQDVLPGMAGELQEILEGADVGFFQEVSGEKPRSGLGYSRALQGFASRNRFRSGPIHPGTSSQDRQGPVRTVGAAFYSGQGTELGEPIAGQDRAGARLHDNECARGAIRVERDDEHVGRGASPCGGRRDQDASEGERKPPTGAVGSEVEGTFEPDWLDGVRSDLDQIGYSFGACDIPACAVDAPHIRQRLYWCAVGDASERGRQQGIAGAEAARHGREPAAADQRIDGAVADRASISPSDRDARAVQGDAEPERAPFQFERCVGRSSQLVHAAGIGRREGRAEPELRSGRPAIAGADASGVTLGGAFGSRLEGQRGNGDGCDGRQNAPRPVASPDGRNGSAWSDHEWLVCHDGKARRTEPGLRLLVDGMAGRIPAWRLGGNAIVAPLAAEVIAAFLDCENDLRRAA